MLPPDELTRDQPKQVTFLFKRGAAGDAAYIVHSGLVGVFKEIEDGRFQLAMLKDGELFDEVAIIDGSPRWPRRWLSRRALSFATWCGHPNRNATCPGSRKRMRPRQSSGHCSTTTSPNTYLSAALISELATFRLDALCPVGTTWTLNTPI